MDFNKLTNIHLGIFLLIGFASIGQSLPNVAPPTPQASTLRIITPGSSPTSRTSTAAYSQFPSTRTNSQLNQYERDRKHVAQRELALKEVYKEVNSKKLSVRYSLPNRENDSKTFFYRKAFDSLIRMNPDSFSIKDATFIIENAFYDNTKDYENYSETIANLTSFIKKSMQAQGLKPENNLAKNLSIYQFITDTVTVGKMTHNPYKYDFNDYMGQENWDNMFVSKLIYNGSGQCNSMPRLYQILAEELGAEAHLAFAPNHSFIKFQDNLGDWYNAELTSGALMADALMLSSGFIKSETVINGNYVTAQTNRQVMAQLLNDLASGYISKFGVDGFVEQIINKSLELNPNGINGNLHKIKYQIAQMSYVAQQLEAKHPSQLQGYPRALELHNGILEQDRKLKNIGFENMPKERYEAWLKSLEKEKSKQEEESLLNSFKIQKTIKD